MAQEAFMRWDQIEMSWKQLKETVFHWFRAIDDNGVRFDLIGAEISRDGQSSDAQPTAFYPDDRAKRSEFSLHIGC